VLPQQFACPRRFMRCRESSRGKEPKPSDETRVRITGRGPAGKLNVNHSSACGCPMRPAARVRQADQMQGGGRNRARAAAAGCLRSAGIRSHRGDTLRSPVAQQLDDEIGFPALDEEHVGAKLQRLAAIQIEVVVGEHDDPGMCRPTQFLQPAQDFQSRTVFQLQVEDRDVPVAGLQRGDCGLFVIGAADDRDITDRLQFFRPEILSMAIRPYAPVGYRPPPARGVYAPPVRPEFWRTMACDERYRLA
jgi:hypothetical protein